MSFNQPETTTAKANAAWGASPPRWVALLAAACDRSSQRAVADQLSAAGFRCSSGTVSKLVNAKYPASTAEPEKAVLAVFGGDEVDCPLFGLIPLQSCIRARRHKGAPRNPADVMYAKACPSCPHNTDRADLGEGRHHG